MNSITRLILLLWNGFEMHTKQVHTILYRARATCARFIEAKVDAYRFECVANRTGEKRTSLFIFFHFSNGERLMRCFTQKRYSIHASLWLVCGNCDLTWTSGIFLLRKFLFRFESEHLLTSAPYDCPSQFKLHSSHIVCFYS